MVNLLSAYRTTSLLAVSVLCFTAVALPSTAQQNNTSINVNDGVKRVHVIRGGAGEKGSGTAKEETRKLPKFKSILLSTAANLEAIAGQQGHSVEISIDDNLLPLVKTTVENEVLTISTEKSFSTKLGLKIKVAAKQLQSINMKGSGKVHADHLDGKMFEATIGGAGEFEAVGTVDSASASIKGSGNVHFDQLKTKSTSVDISGAGNASVFASDSLDVKISGCGNVDCKGNPSKVKKDITGSGNVNIN